MNDHNEITDGFTTSDPKVVINYQKNSSPPKQDIVEPIQVEGSPEDNYTPETALGLGGTLDINGIEFPPPTTGFLIFLDLIESPFIKDEKEIEAIDVFQALYVLKYRADAVKPLFGIYSSKKYLDKYESIINESPEHFRLFMAYREKYEQKLGEFKARAAEFGEKLGAGLSIDDTALQISLYIKECLCGFQTIPDSEKKKE